LTKRQIVVGIALSISFFVVLGLMLTPIWNGKTFIEYADDIFCSISKKSVYFIPKVSKEVESVKGYKLEANIKALDSDQIRKIAVLYKYTDADVKVVGYELKVNGDLYKILKCALTDADLLYKGESEVIRGKYNYGEKEVLYNWWYSLKQVEKTLKRKGHFKEAIIVEDVITKAIEPAYNYYGIKEIDVRNILGVFSFLLIFYVVYTVWWGFAIYYLFEGLGLKVTKAKEKKEV